MRIDWSEQALQDEVVSIVTIFHGARLLGPEHLSGLV